MARKQKQIIGIGASAGGLKALQSFIGAFPGKINAPIIFMQHLSPDHKKSLLPELLQNQRPDLIFVEIKDGDPVKPRTIYLAAPGKDLSIENGVFKLYQPTRARPRCPIDFFFSSLAREYGEQSIGVIFSGTGADGTRGCSEIRSAGGLVLVQDPSTAEFDGMPGSVINSSNYDQILSPEKIAFELQKIIESSPIELHIDGMKRPEQFDSFFDLMYRKTGYRLNYYKYSMIGRRISRRLCFLGITKFDDYISVLESDDQEALNLASDFMISITCFFRDRSLWDALKTLVVKPLLKEESSEPIRIWIPGCATGEEVYSSAMLFQSEMEKAGVERELQIFASDINDKALAKARAGRYSESAVSDIPTEYLRKYCLFFEDGRSFEVIKELRKLVVFARHDLLGDPPFSKLDLIICRNLLIYFTPEAQEKCLNIFHYSLKENGVLFLGTVEGVGKRSDLFKPFDSKIHLFRRVATGKTHLEIEPLLPEEKTRRAPSRVGIKGPEEKKLPGKEAAAAKSTVKRKGFTGNDIIRKLETELADTRIDLQKNIAQLKSMNEEMQSANEELQASNEELETSREELQTLNEELISVNNQLRTKIHEQEATNWELKESEDRFRTMANAMPQLAWIANADGYIYWFNNRWYEYTGTTPERMEGWGWQSVNDPSVLPSVIERWKSSVASGEPFDMEVPLRGADGEFRDFLTRVMPLKDSNENVIQWFGTCTDVSERKKSEEVRARLSSIVESSSNAIIGKTLDGIITSWNRAAEGMYGYSEEEVKGKPISILVPHGYIDEVPGFLKRVGFGESVINYDTVRMRKDGTLVPVSLTVSPVKDSHGRIIGASTIAHDISDRKRLEEQLERRIDDLAAVNKELESFSYSVAHDLRNPLKTISGFVDFLKEDCGGDLNDECKDYLVRVGNGTGRMYQIIDDILALSKISRQEMEIGKVDLSEMARLSVRELSAANPGNKVDVAIQKGLTARGDGRLISVALGNLLSNAWKYSSRVENPKIEFGAFHEDGKLIYYVKDNGAGFDMSRADKLFAPFQRLHSDKEFPGTGVGLAIVERAIIRHGGKVWAEGAPGKGATFYFTLG